MLEGGSQRIWESGGVSGRFGVGRHCRGSAWEKVTWASWRKGATGHSPSGSPLALDFS